jgi:hypothetical protein
MFMEHLLIHKELKLNWANWWVTGRLKLRSCGVVSSWNTLFDGV